VSDIGSSEPLVYFSSNCNAVFFANINVYRKFQMAIKGANTIDITPPPSLGLLAIIVLLP
jgi:hypothetical protein